MIDIDLDNNVWDLLFDLRLDLCAELPRGEFRVSITREGEMEMTAIPERRAELREFIEATIARCGVETDAHFGGPRRRPAARRATDRGVRPRPLHHRRGGPVRARAPRRRTGIPRKPGVKLRKNEADIALAARSFRGVVLTRDKEPGALGDAHRRGGKVVFLNGFEGSGMTLREFVRAAL